MQEYEKDAIGGEAEKKTTGQSSGKELYEWMQALVCSVLAVVLVFTFLVRLIGVEGHSMLPSLQDQDRLIIVNSLLYHNYKAGDIVVVRKESLDVEPIVKRIVAVGGQTVDIDFETGSVFVDGEELNEPYINELTLTPEGTEFPLTVPEGSLFLMGDNRNASSDSRDSRLGTVDERLVIGRAFLVVFPGPDSETGKRDFSRIGLLSERAN